jgi:hypothetical protein
MSGVCRFNQIRSIGFALVPLPTRETGFLDGFAQQRHGLGTELAFGGVFVLPMTLTLHSFVIVSD